MAGLRDIKAASDALVYDRDSGALSWKQTAGNRPAGTLAGCIDGDGYLSIVFRRKRYMAHRIAWFIVHGREPVGDIDHRDGNRSNNAIANLREATRSQNNANSKVQSNNKTGLKGVCLHKLSGLYRANICKNGRQIPLGYFKTPEEAHAAYRSAAAEVHGEFARLQ